jgi:hypothetical protein
LLRQKPLEQLLGKKFEILYRARMFGTRSVESQSRLGYQ